MTAEKGPKMNKNVDSWKNNQFNSQNREKAYKTERVLRIRLLLNLPATQLHQTDWWCGVTCFDLAFGTLILIMWLYLPSSGKHEGSSSLETSWTCQWLIICLFSLLIAAARAREGPIAFRFGAAASHCQPRDILFLAGVHLVAKCNFTPAEMLVLSSGYWIWRTKRYMHN